MCVQCAAGAMTAVAGASGARMWLEAKVPVFSRPRVRRVARRTILVGGVLAAGVLGPSAHGPSATSDARPAAAGVVVAAPITR